MWEIVTTIRLLQNTSGSADRSELLFPIYEHVRRSIRPERVLVLSNAGLTFPQYRLVHDVTFNGGASGRVATPDEVPKGGLLADLVYRGGSTTTWPWRETRPIRPSICCRAAAP